MKIKKEFKEHHKFFKVICHFFNNIHTDNISYNIKKEAIILKIKNKKTQLIFHVKSKDIEIKTVLKSKKMNFENLKNPSVVTNAGNFKLMKNVSYKDAVSELLFFIIHSINNDFYTDDEINEIESHSYSMSLSQIQKHLYLHHGKKIDNIGNILSNKIFDKTRNIMSGLTEYVGSSDNRNGLLPFTGYSPFNVTYCDNRIIEDQFISYKKIFCGHDFLIDLNNNLKSMRSRSLFTLSSNIKHINIAEDVLRFVSLFIYERLIGKNYTELKKIMIHHLLNIENNGKERIIHKILYVVNYIDNTQGKLNFIELYKLLTVMCINICNDLDDKNSTKNIESIYSNKKHITALISIIDVIDSIVLHFYISNFLEKSITVSVDGNICDIFYSMEKFDHIDTVEMNNNFFIRVDPKYNNGIYAILYYINDDSAMIMIESNGSHRLTVICSSILASSHEDYIFSNNSLFMLNINEGHYADITIDPLDFYKVYADMLDTKIESIQTMLFSLNDESYFESNETFNIVCNNDIKNSQLYLTYDKDATYKINFWKSI